MATNPSATFKLKASITSGTSTIDITDKVGASNVTVSSFTPDAGDATKYTGSASWNNLPEYYDDVKVAYSAVEVIGITELKSGESYTDTSGNEFKVTYSEDGSTVYNTYVPTTTQVAVSKA